MVYRNCVCIIKDIQLADWRLDRRDWSKELAYALNALFDSADSCTGSELAEDVDEELRIEKRLDCELDGVRTGRVVNDAGGERAMGANSERVGVVPYG